jgi:hypothetical protein
MASGNKGPLHAASTPRRLPSSSAVSRAGWLPVRSPSRKYYSANREAICGRRAERDRKRRAAMKAGAEGRPRLHPVGR